MNYQKYNKAQVSSILLHTGRGIDSPDTHEHSNEQIDPSRTHLNYDLKDRDGLTPYQYHKAIMDDISAKTKARTGKDIRKDAVTLCSWAITAPKDLPEDKQREFFEECYKWFAERYGEENIVTAAVHLDETSPHMHLQFVPIVKDKDGTERLCAKDLETPKRLKAVHPTLQKHLTEQLGCPVELLNGATVNGRKTVAELKVEKAEERASAAEQRAEQAEQRAEQAESRATEAESYLVNLLDGVPPCPQEPKEPTKSMSFTAEQAKQNAKEYKAQLKEYKKAAKAYPKARKEWESKYLTPDNIGKAKAMVENQRSQIQPTLARARAAEQAAASDREKAKAEKEKAEKERQMHSESVRNEALRLTREREAELFGRDGKSRTERLESFCEGVRYENGESVLDRFEQQEDERRQEYRQTSFRGR